MSISSICRHKNKGATLTETIAGCMIIIPLFFLLIDAIAVLVAQTQNDALAKHAARAAAEKDSESTARAAADTIINKFRAGNNNLCSNVTIDPFTYDIKSGQVYVVTKITCYLPVPLPPFGNKIDFKAEVTEPIVALPPQ